MISYLLPTRDRHARLQSTLDALDALGPHAHDRIGGAQVIVVDNASNPPVRLPAHLARGLAVHVLRNAVNHGAAARNIGAQFAVRQFKGDSSEQWLVMLDDDSYPLDAGLIEAVLDAPADVAAVGAEIVLPDGSHESGGLPEVFIGCGVAIRATPFLALGGYDRSFDYYAEEYDLAARFILDGWRIIHDRRFRVRHEKITAGRDFNRILHRLVRNNAWVIQRYAPEGTRDGEIAHTIARYAQIAIKEHAAGGFATGMSELLQTLPNQPTRTMSSEQYDRFTGLAHARQTLAAERFQLSGAVALTGGGTGKNRWAIGQALRELDVCIVNDPGEADALVIGTMSPGPMLDEIERQRVSSLSKPVVAPWQLLGSPARRPAQVA